MNLKFRLLITTIFLFVIEIAHAQLNTANLVQYKEDKGVPSGQVSNVLVDNMGFVWVGTANGLAKFDGYEFKRFYFNPNDSTSIHGQVIYSLMEDHKGHIWVGASPSFLNEYDPSSRKFRQYRFNHLVRNPYFNELNIRVMCHDRKGRLYFGVQSYYDGDITNALLYKDENDDSLRIFPIPDSLRAQNVYRLNADENGRIWLLNRGGMFKIDENRKLSRMSFIDAELLRNGDYPNDLKSDGKGHLWVITFKDHLYDIDLSSGRFTDHHLKELYNTNDFGILNSLHFQSNGDLWLGNNGGLYQYDLQQNKVLAFNTKNNKELDKLPIVEISSDSFGNVWAGSFTGGLLKYENKPRLKSYVYDQGDKNSITASWVNLIREDSFGKIWATSSGSDMFSGVNILDPVTGILKPYRFPELRLKNNLQFNGVLGIWEHSPGLMYCCLNMSGVRFPIYALSEADMKFRPVNDVDMPDSIPINYYLQDSKGNRWISSTLGLYLKGNGSAAYQRIDLSRFGKSNSSSNEVTYLQESKKYGLWILSNNGLYRYDYKTREFTRHGANAADGDTFMTQDVNSMYEAPDGTLWVGTWQGGLSHYDPATGKIKTYTRENGLPSMSIQSILADEKTGSLWLSTFEGISRFNIEKQVFSNYSLSDGLQGLLFADGSALKTSKGMFVFGGANGITIFDPAEAGKISVPPMVYITDLKLFNKSVLPGDILKDPIYETDSIVLNHNQNNISIEFIALHYSEPSRNRYAFKLENYDNEWRDVGNQHIAYYPTLPPGEYVFRVKAANDKGIWNEKGAVLHIIVQPPWWRTIWAYILYGILLILIGYALNRYLKNRVLEKEREKNRSRELEQAKEIEKAYHKLEESHETLKATQKQLIQSEKMASLGELTAGIAHEIQNPLNFVNNFSEVNGELTEELIEAVRKGDTPEAISLAQSIAENEAKIKHHGKRADAIVKSMLQHSRTGSDNKELTDINQLADEYLRLAFHGWRAKDKSFNVELASDFDSSVKKINIISQDIGRVILNLLNNAFYAVQEKEKNAGGEYAGKVTVSTRADKDKIVIAVADNGMGLPANAREKIFQPFFTTKPTGQGTGLGLSLSYDIVKAHGGDITVTSTEGEGTVFQISLPYEP